MHRYGTSSIRHFGPTVKDTKFRRRSKVKSQEVKGKTRKKLDRKASNPKVKIRRNERRKFFNNDLCIDLEDDHSLERLHNSKRIRSKPISNLLANTIGLILKSTLLGAAFYWSYSNCDIWSNTAVTNSNNTVLRIAHSVNNTYRYLRSTLRNIGIWLPNLDITLTEISGNYEHPNFDETEFGNQDMINFDENEDDESSSTSMKENIPSSWSRSLPMFIITVLRIPFLFYSYWTQSDFRLKRSMHNSDIENI